mgnify:CR=1 FL=1
MRSVLPALLVAFGLALAAPAAMAAAEEPPAPSAALDPMPDDRELVDFVSAFVRLMGVQHGYMMLISQEPDPMRVEELKVRAVEDMEEAIRHDGMSVDRYNSIALAIREDTALQGRVEGIIEQMASDPSAEE